MNAQRKVAVITGASRGIGAGLVRGFLDRGYRVVANSLSTEPVVRAPPHGTRAVNADYERLGQPAVTLNDIRRFRQLDSKAPGHPEYHWVTGVEGNLWLSITRESTYWSRSGSGPSCPIATPAPQGNPSGSRRCALRCVIDRSAQSRG